MLRDDYLYTRTSETTTTGPSRLGPDAFPRPTYVPPLRSYSPTHLMSNVPAGSAPPPPGASFGHHYGESPSPFSTHDYPANFVPRDRSRPSAASDRSTMSEAFGFLQYLEPPPQPANPAPGNVGPVWQDGLVLSETHYHHGDHHHNHHQRHIHHFHDLHILGSAEEVLDLRNAPQPTTTIIPGTSVPQLKMRPDVLGRQAFETGLESFFSSLSTRFDALSHTAPMPMPMHMADPMMSRDPMAGHPYTSTRYDIPISTGHTLAPTATTTNGTTINNTNLSNTSLSSPMGGFDPMTAGSSIHPTTGLDLSSHLNYSPAFVRRTPVTEAELRAAERRVREGALTNPSSTNNVNNNNSSVVETHETYEVRDGGDPTGEVQEVTTIVKTTRTVRQVKEIQEIQDDRPVSDLGPNSQDLLRSPRQLQQPPPSTPYSTMTSSSQLPQDQPLGDQPTPPSEQTVVSVPLASEESGSFRSNK